MLSLQGKVTFRSHFCTYMRMYVRVTDVRMRD